MLEIREEDDIVTITVAGRLEGDEYASFVPAFERLARRRGRMPVLLDARRLHALTSDALWRDLRFDVKHRDDNGPLAVLGNQKWMKWAITFARPFYNADVRYFDAANADDARDWLKHAA